MKEEAPGRETFAGRLGLLAAMIGVAVGLGNVWRFPYMVGRFGGAAFVLLYLAFAFLIGVPALMAEWTLGRETRRGSVGAYQLAGLPGGRVVGWILFSGVAGATGYYCNAIGWVWFHGLGELLRGLLDLLPEGGGGDPAVATSSGALEANRPLLEGSAILPPAAGFSLTAFRLQLLMTVGVVLGATLILRLGIRRGVERVSRILTPLLFVTLFLLILRSLTLPDALAGLRWFILKFRPGDITASVAMAALGQAVFSLALGGTFMVVYGSYLRGEEDLAGNALLTVTGDTSAGLLAGIAIFPAVFALGLEPGSGPALIFSTLPSVFAGIPGGWLFGFLFFLSLGGVAFLSAVAAFEVLVAGLTDNTPVTRGRAVVLVAVGVFLLALPPMINMRVFLPWDLAFGSGLQSLGVLVAVVTVGWAMDRSAVLRQMAHRRTPGSSQALLFWVRWVIPAAMLLVGGWWVSTEALPAFLG